MTNEQRHRESAARRKRIAEYVQEGHTRDEAATYFGVSMKLVHKACKEHNVPGHQQMASTRSIRIIADIVNTADTFDAIAQRHGVSKNWVSKLSLRCRQAGIIFHPRVRGPRSA